MSEVTKLGIPETIELLNRAIAEKGATYVYRGDDELGCVYRNRDGTPACIVGHVFAYVELPFELITEGQAPDQEPVRYRFTDEAIGLLDRVQSTQDDGTPWGTAVEVCVAELTPEGDEDE